MSLNVRIKAKNSTGYATIFPKSVLVDGEEELNGKVFGVYTYTLLSSAWGNSAFNIITVENDDILSTDTPYVTPMITTSTQQIEWYKLAEVTTGNGRLSFRASEIPQVDLDVQVWWVR